MTLGYPLKPYDWDAPESRAERAAQAELRALLSDFNDRGISNTAIISMLKIAIGEEKSRPRNRRAA